VQSFDVIIIGLGHAGCEASLACARVGLSTAAVTLRADRAAVMSCNPAIGGTAKGHLVHELDALGGQMARTADQAGTHFVTLNASKGPAVRATRVLCDREAYARAMQHTLATQPHLTTIEGEVSLLHVEQGKVRGVQLADGRQLQAPAVVVTTGTFLQALMHLGAVKEVGGRLGDGAATGLSDSLRELGFELARFKTGTPARLKRSSIDFSRCERQPSDPAPRPISLRTPALPFPLQPLVDCWVTYTQGSTHEVLRRNLHRSPLYRGDIVGRGPRYCPSVEDKVVRFASKARHTVFLEPEGPTSDLVYPAGLSTSLPADVQLEFLRTIPGLEAVEVERYGYAVEYDFAQPTQLLPTLETRKVQGLYFAGQLNGTSGYEEAAFQGLMAGINAGLQVRGEPALVLGRHEAHGGVLLDELVTHGVDEPFRMFTSRSEHRLKLREGNAALRLSTHGHRVGLVGAGELGEVEGWRTSIAGEIERLTAARLLTLLKRPEVTYDSLVAQDPGRPALPGFVRSEVEIEVKYAGYIAMADASLARSQTGFDDWTIPDALRWDEVPGLSSEARERLGRGRPGSVGHARRLPGVSPTAIGLVLVHLKRLRHLSGST
jgi:tRNA uridine 5-carboxymethylaminomethyl modification enzyme